MSSQDQKHRSHLPMPNTGRKGLITFDAKDPDIEVPADRAAAPTRGCAERADRSDRRRRLRRVERVRRPVPDADRGKTGRGGLKYNRFHTTALCSPTRQALLTGRNHHSVGMGGITEIATGAPGYCSVLPNSCRRWRGR